MIGENKEMRNKFNFILLLMMFSSTLRAQPSIQWQKSLGGTADEESYSVKATNDGGCIVVGSSASFDGDVTGNHGGYSDGWIVKLDVNGDIEWERTVGGSSQDALNGVALTPDGGYIAVGNTSSDDGDVSGYHIGDGDIWVIKFDSLGNIEWNNCYGGTGGDFARKNIAITSDGGYIFAGVTSSSDGDVTGFHPAPTPWGLNGDIWAVKINSGGMIQWQKCLGGSRYETASDILETNDNGYIIYGNTWGSYDGDVIGNTDTSSASGTMGSIWIVKLDSTQNIVWQKTYGGTNQEWEYRMLPHEDNGYTFLATTWSFDGDVVGYPGDTVNSLPVFWLVHIDSSGFIQWQNCYGGDSCIINNGDLKRTPAGGYAIGGTIISPDSDFPDYHVDPLNNLSGDIVVLETDSVGNLQYQHCYGSFNNDNGYGIAITTDNSLVVTGSAAGNDGDVSGHHGPLNTTDVWTFKLGQTVTGVRSQEKLLHAFKVYPNPVSTVAKIDFYLPGANMVTVSIYDLSGKEIKTVMNKNLINGYHQVYWDCETDDQQPVPSGIFIVRITAGEYAAYSKVTVIR